MRHSWVPLILWPDCTRPCPIAATVASQTPTVAPPRSAFVRRCWGRIHSLLARFSRLYCSWFAIRYDMNVMDLPFGLVLKWTDRTRVEEAHATRMVRAADMPAPRVLSCGEHPGNFRFCSILMTRLPGFDLYNSGEPFEPKEEGPWVEELGACLDAMRRWESPFGARICSTIGTSISSQRVPRHKMGPLNSEQEMNDYLLSFAGKHDFASEDAFQATLTTARKIYGIPHRVVFTHGDFKAHNIMITEDGHLSGFLDWESAGWCPEYWDYITAMRFGYDLWWGQATSYFGGDHYKQEFEYDRALNKLTVDSYIGM